jgi:hypothetical protein
VADGVLVRARFDPATERSVSVTVVETLALVVDEEEALPPLGRRIDTDSIDALFSPQFGSDPPAELELSFPYERWLVTVSGAGEIVISARSDHEIPSD